jgi:hypothetical protein
MPRRPATGSTAADRADAEGDTGGGLW